MIDISKMTPAEKDEYIFKEEAKEGIYPFGWLDRHLIGDMATFLDGINLNYGLPVEFLEKEIRKGGGNLSFPILICTTLELASSFYCGKAKGIGPYNARENVKKFVTKYFPGFYAQIPIIFWDGVRNGLTHRFYPNNFKYREKEVTFHFYIEDARQPSHIWKSGNHVSIYLNVPELYALLKDAITKYRGELITDDNLKNNFIIVHDQLRETQNITDQEKIDECNLLFKRLEKVGEVFLKNNKDSTFAPEGVSGPSGSTSGDLRFSGASGPSKPK
jgi:hypothetical protein